MDLRRPENYRVFYPLRRGVLVTDGWFCDRTQRLAVREIGAIGWCQSPDRHAARSARLVVGTEVALVIGVGVIATEVAGPSYLAFGLATLHLAFVTLVAWFTAYRYPGPLQLWAQYRSGAQILLFSSTDQTEFHKVRRAMQRAIEYNRELAA